VRLADALKAQYRENAQEQQNQGKNQQATATTESAGILATTEPAIHIHPPDFGEPVSGCAV
jgi:hypothetical protein